MVTAMGLSTYRRIPKQCHVQFNSQPWREIRAANGQPLKVKGTATLRFKMGKLEILQNFVVIGDLSQQILLGSDFFVDQEVIMDFGREAVTIKGETHPLICHLAPKRRRKRRPRPRRPQLDRDGAREGAPPSDPRAHRVGASVRAASAPRTGQTDAPLGGEASGPAKLPPGENSTRAPVGHAAEPEFASSMSSEGNIRSTDRKNFRNGRHLRSNTGNENEYTQSTPVWANNHGNQHQPTPNDRRRRRRAAAIENGTPPAAAWPRCHGNHRRHRGGAAAIDDDAQTAAMGASAHSSHHRNTKASGRLRSSAAVSTLNPPTATARPTGAAHTGKRVYKHVRGKEIWLGRPSAMRTSSRGRRLGAPLPPWGV